MDNELFSKKVYSYLELISAYLNKKELKDLVIYDSDFSFYLKLSRYHSLTALFYKALIETKVTVDKDKLKLLEEYYLNNVRKVALFEKERNELYKFLNENEINFLPLKGLALMDCYPDPYVREFADYDILFGSKDEEIKKFFVDRKYQVKVFRNGNHDVYLKKPFYNFEMHRVLFSGVNNLPGFLEYFDNYISKSHIKNNHEHYLKPEDFYIYFTAHTYKHYNGGGCGIRTLVDYYLFLKNNKLDFEYIEKELVKLKIADFSNTFISLSLKIFDNLPLNEEEEKMFLYISSSGTYGTIEEKVNKGIKQKGKFRYLMSRIFPPRYVYISYFPPAYKCVLLVPLGWIIRSFRLVFGHSNMKAEFKAMHKYKKNDDE